MNRSATAPGNAAAGGGLGRTFVTLSVVLHVLAFLFAVGVPRLLSTGPRGNKVYVVDLVSLPGNPAPAAPAPAAAAPAPPKPAPVKAPEAQKPPEVKKAAPKPPPKPIVLPDKDAAKKTTKAPEKPVPKVEKEKAKEEEPPPKAVEPPDKDSSDDGDGAEETAAAAAATPPTTTPPAAGAPAAGAGATPGAGAGGTGSGAGSGDEFDFYMAMLKRRIEMAWKRPVSTSREVRTAAVYIELSPTGRLLKLELRTPSGYAPFDRSIIQAVRDAEPFPPFPISLKMDRLSPTLEFELTPLGGATPP